MENNKLKHLEFIQDIITRMNSNSFQIKNFAIIITAALLGIYASEVKIEFIYVAFIPVVLFWFLDAYYLQQERKFRGLYDDAVKDMSYLFDMSIAKYKRKKFCFWNSFFSRTIFFLYLSMILILCLIIIVSKFSC